MPQSAAPVAGRAGLVRRTWRRLKWPLAGLVASLLLAAGYGGYLWARYQRPSTPLPAAGASVGERFVAPTLPDGLAAEAAARLLRAHAAASLPAASAAIGIAGELLWAEAVGYADLESLAPVHLASRFRLGSTSKPLTGVLLGRLAERGAIHLDGPIGDLVDDLPAHLAPITPRQLASHTAGIRNYRWDLLSHPPHEALQNERYASVSEALPIFVDDPLRFAPGTGFGYSTYGFVLLSRALEVAGGVDFPSLMAREVFAQAGMSESAAEHAGPPHADVVSYYETGDGRYTRSFPVDNSFRWAGGGFLASARDLVKLGNALLAGDLVSAETRATLFAAQPLPGGEANPQSYALGWRSHESTSLLGEEEPIHVVHHGGRQVGGAAFLLLVPPNRRSEAGIAVAVLANSGSRTARHEVQTVAVDLARLCLLANPAG